MVSILYNWNYLHEQRPLAVLYPEPLAVLYPEPLVDQADRTSNGGSNTTRSSYVQVHIITVCIRVSQLGISGLRLKCNIKKWI